MAPKPKKSILKTQIDDNLKRIFEEDANEELPESLRSLLERLDEDSSDSAAGQATERRDRQ